MVDVSTNRNVDIIKFSIRHISLMDLHPRIHASYEAHPDYRKALKVMELVDWSHTAFVKGVAAASFGVYEKSDGVGEAWMIASTLLNSYPISLTRATHRYFDKAARGMRLNRLQMTTNINDELAVRWANRLQFVNEATLDGYGPDGSDHFLFYKDYDYGLETLERC